MSGASFILTINLFVTGFLAVAFMMVAAWDRARVAARWVALSYLVGMLYFVAEAAIPFFVDARPALVFAFAAFLAATAIFNLGVARKYGIEAPVKTIAAIFAVSVITVWFAQDLPRHSFTRMIIYQTPYFLMQAIAAGLVLRAPGKRMLDYGFAALLTASSLQFLSKPFIALALGGSGDNPQAYLNSTYAMVSQTMGTVFAMAIALAMLVLLVRDLLVDVTQKSETDALSGLLNRRGFEQHAAATLSHAAERNMPVSLIIADIDRFKSINDSFGHPTGDRVISAFAAFLRDLAGEGRVCGRMGGEEFAILLPGANMVAARLFAEGARAGIPALAIEGIPAERRITASFGVAERLGGESVSDLLRRADLALYEAKNEGRDCVRVARTGVRLAQAPAA